jgi:hypothetical protein
MFPSILGESLSHELPPKIVSEISTFCEVAEPIEAVATLGEAPLAPCWDALTWMAFRDVNEHDAIPGTPC